MPRRTLRVRLHRKDASGHPLGTALRACRRMPTAVCTFARVPHKDVCQIDTLVRPCGGAYLRVLKFSQMYKI